MIDENGDEHSFYNFGGYFSIPYVDAGLGILFSGERYAIADFVNR